MREGDLTYDDFLQRLNIQDVLIDAGYHLNRRDGLRYPSYVRIDSEGRRIRGDKFIVTQQGKCCFQAQQQKVYNIISFIKEHPQFFTEYRVGTGQRGLYSPSGTSARSTSQTTTCTSSTRRTGRHRRSSILISRAGVSTSTRNMPSTATSVWRRNIVRTVRHTPISLFR